MENELMSGAERAAFCTITEALEELKAYTFLLRVR